MEDKFCLDDNGNVMDSIARETSDNELADSYLANRELALVIHEEFASVDGDAWLRFLSAAKLGESHGTE